MKGNERRTRTSATRRVRGRTIAGPHARSHSPASGKVCLALGLAPFSHSLSLPLALYNKDQYKKENYIYEYGGLFGNSSLVLHFCWKLDLFPHPTHKHESILNPEIQSSLWRQSVSASTQIYVYETFMA